MAATRQIRRMTSRWSELSVRVRVFDVGSTIFQSRVGERRGNLTGFAVLVAEERVVNQRRATVGHVGVDGKLGVSHVLS